MTVVYVDAGAPLPRDHGLDAPATWWIAAATGDGALLARRQVVAPRAMDAEMEAISLGLLLVPGVRVTKVRADSLHIVRLVNRNREVYCLAPRAALTNRWARRVRSQLALWGIELEWIPRSMNAAHRWARPLPSDRTPPVHVRALPCPGQTPP